MILVDVLIARNGITEELGERLYFLKYPIPEIPEDSEKISGMDWVLEKISGLGRVSGTRWALVITHFWGILDSLKQHLREIICPLDNSNAFIVGLLIWKAFIQILMAACVTVVP